MTRKLSESQYVHNQERMSLLSPGQTIEQSWIQRSNFARSNIARQFGRPCWMVFVQHFLLDQVLDRVCFWIPHPTLLDVNVQMVVKHYPTLPDETSYRVLNLKTWSSDTETKSTCSVYGTGAVRGCKRRCQARKRNGQENEQKTVVYRMSKIHPRLRK